MRALMGYGFIAPPNVFIALCPLGALLALFWWRMGLILVMVASFPLYVAATPAFSSYVLSLVERDIPDHPNLSSAQAIVVLGADVRPGKDLVADSLGPQSIERLMYTAEAYRKLQLPVAVSGGTVPGWRLPVSRLMKSAFESYLNVPVTWAEDRSQTTYENALYTGEILRAANIRTIVVITQSRDMPRAIWSFEKIGFNALPWPTSRDVLRGDELEDFLPSSLALCESFYGLHELIGALYYRIRY